MKHAYLVVAAAGLLCVATATSAAEAEKSPPPTAEIRLHRMDVIAAASGRRVTGSINFVAIRGSGVYFFENALGPAEYLSHPELYPDTEEGH